MRGLATRVLFFLSLALLPIGLIAISQTQQISKQNRVNGELSLLAVTEQASTAERHVFQTAFSAAEALASIVQLHSRDDAACSRFFRAYLAANPTYRLVGFIEPSGKMSCSSASATFDFSSDPAFAEAIATPKRRAETLGNGARTLEPVTVVTTPAFEDGTLTGMIALSIPSDVFLSKEEPELPAEPLAMMTFNAKGEILTAEHELDAAHAEVPADIALQVFVGQKATVFTAANQNGDARHYAVQPLVPHAVYAVTVWPASTPFLNPPILNRIAALLPIIMWAATLVVAFWALNRLAIRHIRKLGRQMRRFALNRNLPRTTLGAGVPTELIEMEAAFINMGESILRDEATLEDSLREKNILLKEVHHRVKNNLQLISSIMNMQIRQAKSQDVGRVLGRLQERILSLATVHKNLYQNDNLASVDAAVLLREVVGQLLSVGLAPGSNVKVTQDYASIIVDADDAAPLTLLVSEAVTNALKHVLQQGDGEAALSVLLTLEEENTAKLTVTNTTGAEPDQEGTGLGSRLIEAFARQLNGQVDLTQDAALYQLVLSFPVSQASKQIYDY